MLKALSRLDTAPEELRPYLVEAERGIFVTHPMAAGPLTSDTDIDFEALLARVKFLEARAKEAFEAKRWFEYIFIHAKGFRVDALLTLIAHHRGASRLWPLIGSTWTISEGHSDRVDEWSEVWSHAYRRDGSRRKGARNVMEAKDRRAYDALPESVVVYRGVSKAEYIEGFSWTLSQEKAEWFSTRYAQVGAVGRTTVNKAEILALFDAEGEQEIVIHPFHLKKVEIIRS